MQERECRSWPRIKSLYEDRIITALYVPPYDPHKKNDVLNKICEEAEKVHISHLRATHVDANGRVGSVTSSVVGPSHPEVENPNGQSLRVFAEKFTMYLNNTWGHSGHILVSS